MSQPATRVAVLTGGGDCAGLNDLLHQLARACSLAGIELLGLSDGFAGLLDEHVHKTRLTPDITAAWRGQGGTALGTSNRRSPLQFSDGIARTLSRLRQLEISQLIAIGGDGTLAIASAVSAQGFPVIGLPKTIDNDIDGCDQSLGFETAVQVVADCIERLHTTAASHRRVMLVETMGRQAGWIALHGGISAGADAIVLPECPWTLDALAQYCQARLLHQRSVMVVVAEGAIPMPGANRIAQAHEPDRPEPERLGGIAQLLETQLAIRLQSEVRHVVLGHLQRGGQPIAADRRLAVQLASQAVQAILAGRHGLVIAPWSGELRSRPLAQQTGARRTIRLDDPLLQAARQTGIFTGSAG